MIFSDTRRAERCVTTGLRQVTQAAEVEIQSANCEAPERTSPTSRRNHVNLGQPGGSILPSIRYNLLINRLI